jgi:TolA-binding protein
LAQSKAKYQEAAQLFAVLLQEDPKSPYADVMLWNSARAKVLSGNPMEALPLYKKLYISYPRSEYAKLARFQEALALEKMLKFTEAAQAYDGIIKHEPNTEAAQDALLNKALLYEAAGNNPQAIAAFIAFAKKYPKHAEAPEALLSAAALYKKDRDLNREVEVLEAFTKQYRKDPNEIAATLRAHVSIGDSYGALARSAKTPEQKRRYAQAQVANYKAAVNLFSQKLASPLASFYAAKAQLFLDKPEFDAFLKTKINGRTGKAQAEQLTSMTKQLASLAAKNENIIKTFAQPVWNAESLYRIGSLYEHLAKSILRAPCPTDVRAIDEFACDEYIVLLEDKAAVLEEKALDAFTQAYDIAIASYDAPAELLESIQAALNRVRPGKYQRVGKAIENPQPGAFEGQGRMLSTGRMASSLHEQEVDPDIKKPEPVAPQREPAHE